MRFDQNIRIKIGSLYAARHEPEAYVRLARVYWAFLVCTGAALLIMGLAYGAWEFMKPLPSISESSTVRPQLNVSRTQLQTILEGFKARSEKYEKQRTAPTVKDPS